MADADARRMRKMLSKASRQAEMVGREVPVTWERRGGRGRGGALILVERSTSLVIAIVGLMVVASRSQLWGSLKSKIGKQLAKLDQFG